MIDEVGPAGVWDEGVAGSVVWSTVWQERLSAETVVEVGSANTALPWRQPRIAKIATKRCHAAPPSPVASGSASSMSPLGARDRATRPA